MELRQLRYLVAVAREGSFLRAAATLDVPQPSLWRSVKALEAEADISAALNRYQTERKPIVQKLVNAARTSAAWYENFAEHMKLDLMDFAHSYLTRTGRLDDTRLRAMSPAFMARYEAARRSLQQGGSRP